VAGFRRVSLWAPRAGPIGSAIALDPPAPPSFGGESYGFCCKCSRGKAVERGKCYAVQGMGNGTAEKAGQLACRQQGNWPGGYGPARPPQYLAPRPWKFSPLAAFLLRSALVPRRSTLHLLQNPCFYRAGPGSPGGPPVFSGNTRESWCCPGPVPPVNAGLCLGPLGPAGPLLIFPLFSTSPSPRAGASCHARAMSPLFAPDCPGLPEVAAAPETPSRLQAGAGRL
jgi:hypothetical protein